jgi:saccharopepsin
LGNGWIHAAGAISRDNFRLGSLSLPDQPFLNAPQFEPVGSSWDDMCIVHAVLGLAPSIRGSALDSSSPFKRLVEENLLSKKLFGLRLREPAELHLGGISQSEEQFNWVPLKNKNSELFYDGGWQTGAGYMAVGDSPGMRYSFSDHIASFTMSSAWILLPDDMVWKLLQDLEFNFDEMFIPPFIRCQRRKTLPNITFNLGGQNFTLTPYDYTLEWRIPHKETICVSALIGLGTDPSTSKEIILGSAFLRAFYSVFDLERKEIGCRFYTRCVWYSTNKP